MSTAFPGELDTLTNPTPNDSVAAVSHAAQHANANDAIEALEAKVGKDGSAVPASHDFKLSEVPTNDKAVSRTAAQTLLDKTLTTPIINGGTINTPAINTPAIEGGNHDDAIFDNPTFTGDVEIDLGSDAAGDIYYRNASGSFTRLPKSTDGKILSLVDGIPAWVDAPTSGVTFEHSSGTTHSLTTTASQKVMVIVKGKSTGSSDLVTISLLYNGVTKDTVALEANSSEDDIPFTLIYTETPGAATANITVTTSGGSISDVDIVVTKAA